MEKFPSEMATLYFWVAVVGVGIAVNLISSAITRFVPGLMSHLAFRWRRRSDKAEEQRSLQALELREAAKIVASQPSLISPFLLRAYVLFLVGAVGFLIGMFSFFIALDPAVALMYGTKYSLGWWTETVDRFLKAIFFFVLSVQVFKMANYRYLIATIAEETIFDAAVKKRISEPSASIRASQSE